MNTTDILNYVSELQTKINTPINVITCYPAICKNFNCTKDDIYGCFEDENKIDYISLPDTFITLYNCVNKLQIISSKEVCLINQNTCDISNQYEGRKDICTFKEFNNLFK